MKKTKKSILSLLAATTMLFGSCQNDLDICNPDFSSTTFLNELDQQLNGNVMGYAVVVTKDGTVIDSRAEGKGIGGNDGDRAMSINDRMHVASISKSLTTIATLKVLRDKNINVNTPVANYLPSSWSLGTGFENVTFFHLLNQSANLNLFGTQTSGATVLDSLQAYAAAGASPSNVRNYTNTHHAFLRVLLPRVWDKYLPATGLYDDQYYADNYKRCLQENVFDLIGISNADCQPPSVFPNFAYAGPNDLLGGGAFVDYSLSAGGFGWNLSTKELAQVWAYTFFTTTILEETDRNQMTTNELGLWNSLNGARGRYLCKLGGWSYGNNDSYNSCLMSFPNGVQVAVLMNSPVPNNAVLSILVRDAFDASWNCN